jgi:peptidoglycan hydrolase CwlO-like protein
MKWVGTTFLAVLASFFLWPAQPESRLYAFRSQLTDQFKSIRNAVGVSAVNGEDKQAIANKMAELNAYEDALQKVEADIANAQANVGTCSITGQPNEFRLTQDPRPEIQAKIDQLKEEIKLLEKKS